MCIMGRGKILPEAWKSPGNLFVKMGTSPVYCEIIFLSKLASELFYRGYSFASPSQGNLAPAFLFVLGNEWHVCLCKA